MPTSSAICLLVLALSILAAGALYFARSRPKSIYEEKRDEPLFMLLPNESAEVKAALRKAQDTLPQFRQAIIDRKYPRAFCTVKGYFPEADGSKGAHLWIWVRELNEKGFGCVPFELPKGFNGLQPDQKIQLKNEDVEDWTINDDGTLYGGYSLLLKRAHVPEAEREAFDRFIGAKKYSELEP